MITLTIPLYREPLFSFCYLLQLLFFLRHQHPAFRISLLFLACDKANSWLRIYYAASHLEYIFIKEIPKLKTPRASQNSQKTLWNTLRYDSQPWEDYKVSSNRAVGYSRTDSGNNQNMSQAAKDYTICLNSVSQYQPAITVKCVKRGDILQRKRDSSTRFTTRWRRRQSLTRYIHLPSSNNVLIKTHLQI